MPEAAVHENDLTMSRQDDVGSSVNIPHMKTKAEPHSVYEASYDPFRRRITSLDQRHYTTTFLSGESIQYSPVEAHIRNRLRVPPA
jgi:hypothetical protein